MVVPDRDDYIDAPRGRAMGTLTTYVDRTSGTTPLKVGLPMSIPREAMKAPRRYNTVSCRSERGQEQIKRQSDV